MMRKDLHTNEEFVPKRINQVFATSENRVAYHNKKANELRHYTAYMDKPLLKNLRILKELMDEVKEKTVHKEFLRGKGFSFSVYNHISLYKNEQCIAIYQYTLVNLGNEEIKIIKND